LAWVKEIDTSEAILIPIEACERMVEFCRADPPRLPEIVFAILHGVRANRQAALICPQNRSRRYPQDQGIEASSSKGQVRMGAAPEGAGNLTDVRSRCPYPEPAAG
jgi:hypothetical protein